MAEAQHTEPHASWAQEVCRLVLVYTWCALVWVLRQRLSTLVVPVRKGWMVFPLLTTGTHGVHTTADAGSLYMTSFPRL